MLNAHCFYLIDSIDSIISLISIGFIGSIGSIGFISFRSFTYCIAGYARYGRTSEDCLNLNIFTPALDGKKRPVMFWIHGGGNVMGSNMEGGVFHGGMLAEKHNVVVVSKMRHHKIPLYRLQNDRYGIPCTPESSPTLFRCLSRALQSPPPPSFVVFFFIVLNVAW